MKLYRAVLETHEPLFFATKEIGELYVTEPYISNYALTYALTPEIVSYKHHNSPQYKNDLKNLKFYITPAKFIEYKWRYDIFNSIGEGYYLKMLSNNYSNIPYPKPSTSKKKVPQNAITKKYSSIYTERAKNIPQIGRLKQISLESKAVFYIILYEEKNFPEYIRLGKFNTKCKITYKEVKNINIKEAEFRSKYVLNVLDIPNNINLLSYKIIPIKPVQIIENAIFKGKYIEIETEIETDCIPYNMRYFWGG
ncbi:type I-D CRISPR-associated protein Cas5/Csc1 [Marinitoga sp. 1155]|uniref:type I-D CRISPR-associated protein Cas5/Csc1 n=1 Tax=Marinitoga sp. 1155 TaxID=1428448 RepID=UPI0006416CEF|nr:type I-D CRISPR-associated protein Cas5/Csc1 [Marinitoga sp. 1155]KLO24763.1 hypothetical protein X274_02010 [Marinitoga sp. 1155]